MRLWRIGNCIRRRRSTGRAALGGMDIEPTSIEPKSATIMMHTAAQKERWQMSPRVSARILVFIGSRTSLGY
jgi:hypothetical protein